MPAHRLPGTSTFFAHFLDAGQRSDHAVIAAGDQR
jgi:hypothetical protein